MCVCTRSCACVCVMCACVHAYVCAWVRMCAYMCVCIRSLVHTLGTTTRVQCMTVINKGGGA